VGAGPAGSTTARYAASRGLRTLVLDRRRVIGFPVQCGEFVAESHEILVTFPALEDLEELMRIPEPLKKRRFHTIRVHTPKGRPFDIPFDGYTVNRDEFDRHLAGMAEREGAEILKGTSARRVRGTDVVTDRGTYEGRVVVGADGGMSRVASSVGLPPPAGVAPAVSTEVQGDFPPRVDLFFGSVAPGGYAWVIPKDGAANVGLGTWKRFDGNISRQMRRFMDSMGLTASRITGGWVPTYGPVSRSVKGNVLLVGDAAGHVMATNGGGINLAMVCGRIAGNAIADHLLDGQPLESYESRWRSAVAGPLEEAVRTRRLADRFFSSDRRLELAMRVLGAKRMERAIRCLPLFRRPPRARL
jgi:digeranylgeranylglycerophospholipid reductase